MTKIIPIFCILVATVISIVFLDFNQSKDYLVFSGYDRNSVRINYNDGVSVTNETMTRILELAKENNVILAKSNVSSTDSSIRNIYVTEDNVEQIKELINKKFKVDKLNDSSNDLSFISTYNHNNKNQAFIIRDLLNNNKYNFYTFSTLLNEQGNYYGEYLVYYKDNNDFVNFSNNLKLIVGEDITSGLSTNNLQGEIIILLVCAIFVIMIFYFIFEVYDTYYNSKKIGCMKLLGFDKTKIANLMIKDKSKIYILSSVIILILTAIFVKNINIFQFLFLTIIILILLLITYILNLACVSIILKGYNTVSIIKKQNIAIKISKTSARLKFVITVMMIIGISLLSSSIFSLNSSLKVYNNSKKLLDYGIIKDFNADSQDIFNYDKQSNLYTILYNDKRLSMFYSQFSDYVKPTDDEEAQRIKDWEASGTYFEYASVDRNYLKKENIKIYDLNNNPVNIDDINGVFFLFAKSEKNIISKFENFYSKDSQNDYAEYNMPLNFQAYLYDDQSFDTYRLDLDIKYVKNPRLRVVDDSIKIPYLESSRGISVFGNSLTTGLKIKIDNDNTIDYVMEDVNKAGLSDLIGKSNFLTFKEYFNDEIQRAKTVMISVCIGIILVTLVYFIIAMEVFSLYVKSEQQTVIVKYLLGFNKQDIFKPIIKKNLLYTVIAFIISLLILLLLNIFNIILFIVSVIAFLIIDSLISIIIIKKYKFNKVYIDLKGGEND